MIPHEDQLVQGRKTGDLFLYGELSEDRRFVRWYVTAHGAENVLEYGSDRIHGQRNRENCQAVLDARMALLERRYVTQRRGA